ncbi:MAG TPA: hypothetical protein VKR61_05520 [Bryobacteraceae bacterium]|nr:hypothetical protein [Bryobacteraceae bacterium]
MADFHEEQRFEWFWNALFCLPALMVGFGLYRGVISGALLWPAFLVTVVVAVWFLRLKMVTEVRPDGLFVWFVWLWPERTIPWNQIRSVEARRYRPIRDFGGWGVRWAARGIVYHARGNRGARLELDSGERVLIGSQRSDELVRAIAERTGLTAGGAS